MNGMFSRVTLFDLLSMIVPGYLLLFLFELIFIPDVKWQYDELTFGIVTFAVSYIVGIALHYLARFVFSCLRNNEWLISKTNNRVKADLTKRENTKHASEQSAIMIMSDYYKAYYTVTKFYPASSLQILEAQYSFLRSMLIVGLFYILLGCKVLCACILSGIAALILLSILLMIVILRKIHYVVWEDSHYISAEIQKDKNS